MLIRNALGRIWPYRRSPLCVGWGVVGTFSTMYVRSVLRPELKVHNRWKDKLCTQQAFDQTQRLKAETDKEGRNAELEKVKGLRSLSDQLADSFAPVLTL